MELSYYDRIGNSIIQQLIACFYEEIRNDDVLLPMYAGDLEAAEKRLYMFMVQYLGGPAVYSERRGHPRLRIRHMPFPINENAKQHWLKCMSVAMEKVTMDDESRRFLWNYFTTTADFLKNC
ncbi:MAG: globin [Bacteroidales bacterium]|nr:globin [Bacteroidales bacterium]